MRPKILITIDTYATGGPGKLILQFLKHGGKELCSPMVAGFWRGPVGKWQFREAVEAIGVSFEVLNQKFAFDPSAIRSAYLLAKDNNIQILESHGYKSHVVCLALSTILHIPWVAYVHGWTNENLKVRLYNQLEKMLVRFANRIVPVSHNLGIRLQLCKHDAKKLVNIPNSADPVDLGLNFADVRGQLGISDGERLLAVVGRLSPEKGHRYLLEALPALLKTHPNVRTVFVGEGQEREALVAAIHQHGLEEKIKLVGYQEDVSPYYHACDLLVMPSLSEGMPMVALEAMMFAKPVLATNVGGIPEVVLDEVTGVLVTSKNPVALADALGKMLDDKHGMARLGAAGKLRVEAEFSPATRANRIRDMYRELLS